MSKIISKTYILFLAILLITPSFASALVFNAETSSATSITSTSAKLNGTVSFEEGDGTVWFEYGTSTNLDKKTETIDVSSGSNQKISKTISGLSSSNKYYFRICFQTSELYGTACGKILSFGQVAPVVTTSTTTTSTTNTNSTSSSSTSSTTTSNPKSNTVKSNTTKDESSQSASVANATKDGNFLPDTFLEWIVVIVLIFFVVMFGRYLYVKRQEEKEEEEKRQKEMLIRGQLA